MQLEKSRSSAQSPMLVVVLAIAMAVYWLKGGPMSDGFSASNVVEAERPAFHFQSGTLELGDFDFEEIKSVLFSPCDEISAEEFAAIGFETDGQNQRYGMLLNSCSIDKKGEDLIYKVTGSATTFEETREHGRLLEQYSSDVVPGAYVYGSSGDTLIGCYACVDTVRGQVGAIVGDFSATSSEETLCTKAIELLEDVYVGSLNRNPDKSS